MTFTAKAKVIMRPNHWSIAGSSNLLRSPIERLARKGMGTPSHSAEALTSQAVHVPTPSLSRKAEPQTGSRSHAERDVFSVRVFQRATL